MKLEQLNEGAFCQLKIGRWNASTKLDKSKLGKDVPKEIIRANQDLIDDRTLLKDLSTIKRSARGYLIRRSLSFNIDGVFWVRKEDIPKIDEKFFEFKKEYEVRLEKLIRNYVKMKNDFRRKYPEYYIPDKYPRSNELRRKYYFDWNFFHFVIPDKKTNILSPGIYKRETEKLKNMVKEMEEMTINLVGNMLIKRAEKLAVQCESGNINAATFNSIEEFMKRWDNLWGDFIDEEKMKSVFSSLKKNLKGMNADTLKDNDSFRGKMGKTLEDAVEQIKNISGFELKRKLDI